MPARLDNRPLLGTVDRDLFVSPEIMAELQAAVNRRLNALIVGRRGSGKTTLLRFLEAEHADSERPAIYVDLGPAENAEEALIVIADALGRPWGIADSLRSGIRATAVSSTALLGRVRHLAEAPPSLILIDSPPGNGQSHTLFGRLRDELWQLPHQWVVAANEVLRDELTRPPASAFFDVQFQLDPLSTEQQREFLTRRLRDEPRIDINAMLDQTDGLPRSLLQLARGAVLSSVGDVLAKRKEQRARLVDLPETAAAIVAYIADHGPTSGSDPQLLATLGVSGQRARQILRRLEDKGLLRSFSEQEERRGRPRKLYELNEDIR